MSNQVQLAARVQSSLVIVVGWGDGSVPRRLAEHPAKEVYALRLPGESDEDPGRAKAFRVNDANEVRQFALAHFAAHPEIPALAGVVIVDDHPLSAEAEAARGVIVETLRIALSDQPALYGNDIIDSFMGLYHASLNAPVLLNSPALGEVMGCYGNAPTISIAAGPSLKRHIDELRALQDSCVLVACDAVVPGLLRQGIQPHYITPLERIAANAAFTQNVQGTRCRFAGLPVCHPLTLSPFEGAAIGVAGLDSVYNWFWPDVAGRVMTGSSTGVLSVSLALALNRGPVYLVGHDLAKEDQDSHWNGAADAAVDFKRMEECLSYGSGYESRILPGNNGSPVRSIGWWGRFRSEIGMICLALKREVYNVSAHDGVGAVIDGTLPRALPDPKSLPNHREPLMSIKEARLPAWRAKAQLLPGDARAMLSEMGKIRDELKSIRATPIHTWDINGICKRMNLHAGVNLVNQPVFGYMLRSALFNGLAYNNAQAFLTTGPNRARWLTLEGIDALSGGLSSALSTLMPSFERIAAV